MVAFPGDEDVSASPVLAHALVMLPHGVTVMNQWLVALEAVSLN